MTSRSEQKYPDPGAVELAPGEPFFTIRGKDILAPHAVAAYADLLKRVGQGDQAEHVQAIAVQMLEWASRNRDLLKLPD